MMVFDEHWKATIITLQGVKEIDFTYAVTYKERVMCNVGKQ